MAKEPTVLKQLGWEIEDTLGEGGQAKVYKVRKQGEPEGPACVLKVVRSGQGTQAYERFHREIEALKKVDHPGVVKLVDHGSHEAESLHFYVMEYVAGLRPLKRVMEREKSPFYRNAFKSLDIYICLLEALQQCEKAGVVHRDLSLGNVLITPDNEGVKLIDFGCCHVEDGHSITLVDEAIGTPTYRAPECEDFSGQVTSRADLYSAGKILWSLVTNRKAFGREKPVFNDQALDKVLPKDPTTWHFFHIFAKTIRNNQTDRYKNVAEALAHAESVKDRIQAGFQPLEKLEANLCPVCGFGRFVSAGTFYDNTLIDPDNLKSGAQDWQVQNTLGHLGTVNACSQVCTSCGFTCVIAHAILPRTLTYRQTLQ